MVISSTLLLPPTSPFSLRLKQHPSKSTTTTIPNPISTRNWKRRSRNPLIPTRASEYPTVTIASTTNDDVKSASDVVRSFYRGINANDLASVEELIADNCVYEDLVFPRPFVGRKAILDFFKKFIDSTSSDLQFIIDDISDEDSSAIGVTWHLEWKGKPFPFSKGCSFYRLEVLNGKPQIIYGRDSVEPAIKPGEGALIAIRGVAWLLQSFLSWQSSYSGSRNRNVQMH